MRYIFAHRVYSSVNVQVLCPYVLFSKISTLLYNFNKKAITLYHLHILDLILKLYVFKPFLYKLSPLYGENSTRSSRMNGKNITFDYIFLIICRYFSLIIIRGYNIKILNHWKRTIFLALKGNNFCKHIILESKSEMYRWSIIKSKFFF